MASYRPRRWWRRLCLALCAASVVLVGPSAAQHHRAPAAMGGEVRFPTSCKPAVAGMFDRAVGLLHAFEFSEAVEAFRLVAHSDVDCAMAAWGTAVAHHGRWRTTGATDALDAGRRALASAVHMRSATARERGYLASVAPLFEEGADEGAARSTVLQRLTTLRERHPEDTEAAVMAILAALDQPASDSAAVVARQRDAQIALGVIGRGRNHPGVAHYEMLLARDAGAASRMLDTARASVEQATSAYALMVPATIFVRRGLWLEALETAQRAADAARRDGLAADEARALDTAVYALLQLGRDHDAEAIRRRLGGLWPRLPAAGSRAVDGRAALAAIPARLALERDQWADAAALPVEPNAPRWLTRVTGLVRAIGAARRGDGGQARVAIDNATPTADPRGPLSDDGVAGLGMVAEAWLAYAERRHAVALDLLAKAAQRERTRGAVDASVGPMVLAQEQLADLMAALGRHVEAEAAYQQALAMAPQRLRSLLGVARAAENAGHVALALNYYREVVAMTSSAERPRRASLLDAEDAVRRLTR